MAAFDFEQQRMCVRVVYDGVAGAGKTTNLQQLAELFATQRTCELFSPAEMDGRTLYFDWLEIAAGMACGFPLACQVITVPGQVVLTPRRRHLLATADVIVHVCDSGAGAVERAFDGLALFDDVERERGEPMRLVVQANKQDQRGALSGAALVERLGRPSVPVVEAIASDGIGVVDTFVAAVRAAVRAIQARVEAGDVRVPVQRAETVGVALERLTAEAIDPEWAVEMMLEQASNMVALGASMDFNATGEPTTSTDSADGADAASRSPTARPASAARMASAPTPHVPTGFVWPAHTGRAALRAIADDVAMQSPIALDEEGSVHLVVGQLVLSTGYTRRFVTAEAAQKALVRAARARTQLGALLAPGTVLVVQPTEGEASWLWTIVPHLPTITLLLGADDRAELAARQVLSAYAAALAEVLRLEAQHGLVLDLSAESFGVRDGNVHFVGDDLAVDASDRDVGRALLEALAVVAWRPGDLELLVDGFVSALTSKLGAAEIAKLRRSATFTPTGLPAALRDACFRIEQAFDGDWEAA